MCVFCVSGVFYRRIFTIHLQRSCFFAGKRWKDNLLQAPSVFLQPSLPSVPQSRCLTNWPSPFSKKAPLTQFFWLLHPGTQQFACEGITDSKRRVLVDDRTRNSCNLVHVEEHGCTSDQKFPRSNSCEAFDDVIRLYCI